MGFKLIMAGLIFLFNPSISIYDILPDVIGWALVYGGMYKLRDMAPTMEDAMVQLKRLLWLCGAQAGVMALLPLMTDTGYALTFTFVFAGFECYFMIMFMRAFADGMQYIAVRENSQTPTIDLSNFRTVNYVFPAVKAFLTILPELAYLSTSEYEGWITAMEQFDLANYPTLLRLLNIVGVIIAGLVWLNIVLRYLDRVRKDKALMEDCERYYIENVATQTNMLFCRSLKCGLTLFGAACLFRLDIIVDGISVTPDIISAILFLLGCVVLVRRAPMLEKMKKLSIIYIPLTIATFAVMFIIGIIFYDWGITKSIGGFYMFIGFVVLAALSAAMFVLVIFELLKFIEYLVEKHTGEDLGEEFKRTQERMANMRRELRKQKKRLYVFAVISALSQVLNFALMYAFPEYWMINTALQLAWMWFSVTAIMNVWERVAEKYGVKTKKAD